MHQLACTSTLPFIIHCNHTRCPDTCGSWCLHPSSECRCAALLQAGCRARCPGVRRVGPVMWRLELAVGACRRAEGFDRCRGNIALVQRLSSITTHVDRKSAMHSWWSSKWRSIFPSRGFLIDRFWYIFIHNACQNTRPLCFPNCHLNKLQSTLRKNKVQQH